MDDSALFDHKNRAYLAEAITTITNHEDVVIKYGLKNTLYYLLMSSADMLEGVALTDTDSNVAATELANFKKVLKHHENVRKAGCIDTVTNSLEVQATNPLEVEATRRIQNAKTTKSKLRGFFMMKHTPRGI